MTRAAIYARYSTEHQRDASIEEQVRLCQERMDREGWTVLQTYCDRALSGASLLRPGLQGLIEDAMAGRIEVIVAEALDRLSRDQADVAALFKRFTFAGVRIVTLAEGEISELHIGLKGTMNQLFLKDLADKTRRGLRGHVEAGRSGGGNAYGYDVLRTPLPDGTLSTSERKINATEAPVVLRIFADYARGISPKVIASTLNREGVPGPRGAVWSASTIHGNPVRGTGILNNELNSAGWCGTGCAT
jgi:site-specific DNA recombinase